MAICFLSSCPCRRETPISEPESSRTESPPLPDGSMHLTYRKLIIVRRLARKKMAGSRRFCM